jgi:hypothetical protein
VEENSTQVAVTQNEKPAAPVRKSIPQRVGAAGKALLVYLGTGSIGLALVAYLLFPTHPTPPGSPPPSPAFHAGVSA